MNPSDILKNAKGIILARGWCQKTLMNDVGNVCAMGGLRMGNRTSIYFDEERASPEYLRARNILLQAMMLFDRVEFPTATYENAADNQKIAYWNDRHTEEEVLTAWDNAIELAEIEEEVALMADMAEAERLGELVPA
jgi:hypothetical protein